MGDRQFLTGAKIFTGDRTVTGQALVVENGVIQGLVPSGSVPSGSDVVRLPADSLLAPGFIDAQVNGAGGVLFNETPTVDAALAIAAALRPSGTTGLLPTFITDDRSKMAQACDAAVAAADQQASGVLGLHLEGPFLSRERPGVHDPRYIRAPDEADLSLLEALPARFGPHARFLLTLAPEQVSDTAISRLSASGVVVSLGHTAASYDRTTEALHAGARGFTHLFNAMPPVANREPGPVGAALDSSAAWCGIIADGIHVHPSLLRAAIASKRTGQVFLVTDAMSPVGTTAESFVLYGRTILRRDGRLTTEDGVLAGADIDMISSVRNCIRLLGLPGEEALRMASLYPATFLRLDHELGRIAPGYKANLVLLAGAEPDWQVAATWIRGQVSWHESDIQARL